MNELITWLEKEIKDCDKAMREAYTAEMKLEIHSEQTGYKRSLYQAKKIQSLMSSQAHTLNTGGVS